MKRYSLFLISLILLMTTGCNQRKEVAENPFFEEWETPYGVPPFDRIRPEHFLPAFQRAMSIQEAEIDAIKSNGDQPSFENVILAYDRSGLMLEQVGLVFNMLCSADVNDQLLAAKEQAMPLLAAHRDNILLDEVLFDKIKAVYDRRGSLGLDAVQTRLVEKIYGKFVRAGALLDPQQKERLRQINGELALLVVVLVFTFLVRLMGVSGPSMIPTLQDGDRLLVVNSLLCGDYQVGDIVIARKETFDSKPIVKRVIATAGQTVDIDFNLGQVYVDGELLDEDYINDYTYREEGTVFPLTVPEGEVFLMGDNRNHSNDSRDSSLGTVDTRLLIGKAVFLVFPGRDYLTEQREFGRIGLLQ